MTRGLFIVSWGFSELFGAMPNLVSYLESPITPLLSPSTLQPLALLKLAYALTFLPLTFAPYCLSSFKKSLYLLTQALQPHSPQVVLPPFTLSTRPTL